MADEVLAGIGVREVVDCGEYFAESENDTDIIHMTFDHCLSVFYLIFYLAPIPPSVCILLHCLTISNVIYPLYSISTVFYY